MYATSIDALNNKATFEGITGFSQFIIGRMIPEIFLMPLPLILSFETETFNSIDVGRYSAPTFTDLDGDGLLDMIVGEYDGNLNHYVQDSVNSTTFSEITWNFNSINDGLYSIPAFTDLDGDGLLDLIIGVQNGNLNHYEQESIHSTSFLLRTHNFNSIDVGNNSSPTFTDLDGDGLLDMIVGEVFGNLHHYEQKSKYSNTFTIITSSFNSINIGIYSSPTFTDLDGDGLLDMIVGEYDGNLNHYEQDHTYSVSFSLITENFSSIDVGSYSSPVFIDFDNDRTLDLIVGEYSGNLNHYKLEGVQSMDFGNLMVGKTSTQKYHINGTNLIDDLSVDCTNGFGISLSKHSSFQQTLIMSPVNGVVSDTIFVRFNPVADQVFNDTIGHSSAKADTVYINLKGSGVDSPDGFPGTALDFDGSDDHINCGTAPQIIGDNPRTIEAWAYAESFNNGGIFQAGATGADYQDFSFKTKSTDNEWKVNLWGSDMDIVLPNSKGAWHHYCMTYDGTIVWLYYDGELIDSTIVVLNTGNHDVYFGRWRHDYFDGKIDEVRFWNIALDSIQIRENMHKTLTGNETGLIGYWQFNDGDGMILSEVINGNLGDLKNMESDDWIESTVATGKGTSDTQTEVAGTVDFSGTGLTMYYNSHNDASVTVTRIDTTPNMNPSGLGTTFDSQYWVLNRFGNGTFNTDLTFTLNEDLTPDDQANPDTICLFKRNSNAYGGWDFVGSASGIDHTTNEATFSGVTEFCQYIIGRGLVTNIVVENDSIDFGPILAGKAISRMLKISNT